MIESSPDSPFPIGGANIYRVPAERGDPEVVLSGFTAVIDVAFGLDGSLYVLEMFKSGFLSSDPTGALIQIRPDATRVEFAAGSLLTPGGVILGRDGAFYVTLGSSLLPDSGKVLRITPRRRPPRTDYSGTGREGGVQRARALLAWSLSCYPRTFPNL